MKICNVYHFKDGSLLCVRMIKTVSGFWVSSNIVSRVISMSDPGEVVSIIKYCLTPDISERAEDPKDWTEKNKKFLEVSGLRSIKQLDEKGTKLCSTESELDIVRFVPHKQHGGHTPLLAKTVINNYSVDDQSFYNSLLLALSYCES